MELIGLKADARPRYAKLFRWEKGMPQYTLGHLDRAERIEEAVSGHPGLGLAGGMLRGVGVPNCLESGEKEVSRILAGWGIELAEDSAEVPALLRIKPGDAANSYLVQKLERRRDIAKLKFQTSCPLLV